MFLCGGSNSYPVLSDGPSAYILTAPSIASTFSVSRRRMVVPIYKQWTANIIRLQIVEQDNVIQLLAFFEDFSHADAMNFQLRSTDVFEKTDKGGKFGLKLVDAKFALPVEERRGEGKMQKAEGKLTGWAGIKRKFVCLDEIEYPGEHDDILIQFDSAESKLDVQHSRFKGLMQRQHAICLHPPYQRLHQWSASSRSVGKYERGRTSRASLLDSLCNLAQHARPTTFSILTSISFVRHWRRPLHGVCGAHALDVTS